MEGGKKESTESSCEQSMKTTAVSVHLSERTFPPYPIYSWGRLRIIASGDGGRLVAFEKRWS